MNLLQLCYFILPVHYLIWWKYVSWTIMKRSIIMRSPWSGGHHICWVTGRYEVQMLPFQFFSSFCTLVISKLGPIDSLRNRWKGNGKSRNGWEDGKGGEGKTWSDSKDLNFWRRHLLCSRSNINILIIVKFIHCVRTSIEKKSRHAFNLSLITQGCWNLIPS